MSDIQPGDFVTPEMLRVAVPILREAGLAGDEDFLASKCYLIFRTMQAAALFHDVSTAFPPPHESAYHALSAEILAASFDE